MTAPVVILGGGGFIGANLARRYVEAGRQVYAVDQHFPAFRRDALLGADLVRCDLRDRGAVATLASLFPVSTERDPF